jgi:hypothetical protein
MKMPRQRALVNLTQALSSTLSVRRSAWYRVGRLPRWSAAREART